MGKWFTKDGELKENYIQIVDCETIVKNLRHNIYELKENPKLAKMRWFGKSCKKWDKLANPYQHVLCNSSLKI
jgi:hypothetical protein